MDNLLIKGKLHNWFNILILSLIHKLHYLPIYTNRQLYMDYCAYVACPAPPDIDGLIRSDDHEKGPDAIHNFTTIASYVSYGILFLRRVPE